jgi:hypothetical protein
MVDTTGKIDTIIRDYIEPGEYFVINRARQYGKTTTLELLRKRLANQYLVIQISFEGGEGLFKSGDIFVRGLSSQLYRSLNEDHPELACVFTAEPEDQIPMFALGIRISNLCERSAKPVVLMIDEVDRASDYAIFASFLGLLRTKYLQRQSPDSRITFHNVILAGVHDIKNLKARIRPDSEHAYNSPWNIAAEFTVDMSFSADETEGMLQVYEADHQTGMDLTR